MKKQSNNVYFATCHLSACWKDQIWWSRPDCWPSLSRGVANKRSIFPQQRAVKQKSVHLWNLWMEFYTISPFKNASFASLTICFMLKKITFQFVHLMIIFGVNKLLNSIYDPDQVVKKIYSQMKAFRFMLRALLIQTLFRKVCINIKYHDYGK